MMIDERLLSIQSDPNQLQSISEFTDSLVLELQNTAGSKPTPALLRELLAPGLNRAVNIGTVHGKKRFLDALTGNIHTFPLQEQQSLSKVFPVQISDEYRNLASFVTQDFEEDDDDVVLIVEAPKARPPPAPVGLPVHPVRRGNPVNHKTLADLRRKLAALPATPGPEADELLQRLLDEDLQRVVRDSDEKNQKTFFGDLRMNLYKLSVPAQNTLLLRFSELRADVVRLVESMTQEVSKWLDEEKLASQRGSVAALLTKLKNLFKATLSVPFLATFKHLDAMDKKGKESFLLKIALCIRTCKEKHFAELPELNEQVAELKKQFFFVSNYGELMDEWLNNRVSQCNEEFEQKVTTVLGSNLSGVLARLKRTFRPGRWLSLSDGKMLDDLYALFADKSFPKHILTQRTITKVLKKISSWGGGDFHIFGDIARLPPQGACYFGPCAQDDVDAKLIEVLQRLPPFPALQKHQPGQFYFGRVPVQFALVGPGNLVARTTNSSGNLSEASAEHFFSKRGPEEFPNASKLAVQASAMQHPNGPPCTPLEMGVTLPSPHVVGLPLGFPAMSSMPGALTASGAPLPPWSAAARLGQQRYEPNPVAALPQPITILGVDDDEI